MGRSAGCLQPKLVPVQPGRKAPRTEQALGKAVDYQILCLLMACSFTAFAQVNPMGLSKLTDIVTPSPDVSAMTRYSGVPINKSSGSVNYSVPFFSISAGKLSHSVGLSYSGGGVKVSQTASRTGLNWSLTAGGVISRVVNDEPDEVSVRISAPSALSVQNRAMLNFLELAILTNDGYDTQPDQFNYNFDGFSGRFVLDSAGNVIQIPKSNLKIEHDFDGTNWSFKATAPNGTIYYFGGSSATEKTQSLTSSNCGPNRPNLIPTAWYLTKIVHPNGGSGFDQLSFSYVADSVEYVSGVSQTQVRTPLSTTTMGCWSSTGSTDYFAPKTDDKTCISRMKSYGYHLTGITSSNGSSIALSYDPYRKDLPGDVSLQKIAIKNSSGKQVKAFELAYNQIKTMNAQMSEEQSDSSLYYRMYLHSVTELGNNNSALGAYSFTYKRPDSLPGRLSFSIDHYGFFNNTNNTSMIGESVQPLPVMYSDFTPGDRSTNPACAGLGMLSSITYPTKGKEMIYYEGNSFWSNELDYGPDTTVTAHVAGTGAHIIQTDNKTIVSAFDQIGTFNYTVIENPLSSNTMDSLHNFASVTVSDLTDSRQVFYRTKAYPGDAGEIRFPITAGHSYQCTVTARGEIIDVTGNFIFKSEAPVMVTAIKPIGGARVSKVVSYSNANDIAQQKRYYYVYNNDLDGTSGIAAVKEPVYYSIFKEIKNCTVHGDQPNSDVIDLVGTLGYFYTGYSNSLSNLYSNAGSHVYYASVIESDGGDSYENGGIETRYNVSFDAIALPFLGEYIQNSPATDFSYDNGQETYSLHFAGTPGSPKKIKETFTHYAKDNRNYDTFKAFVVKKDYDIYQSTISPNPTEFYEFVPYNAVYYAVIAPWIYVDTVKVVDYDKYGLNPIVQTTVNAYGNASSLLLSRTKQSMSDGSTKTSEYQYSFDHASIAGLSSPQQAILEGMADLGNIAATAQVSEYMDTVLTTRARVEYEANPATGHYVQSKVKMYNTASTAYEDRLENVAYDANDLLVSQKQTDGSLISYQWGYNGSFPVASCKNAASNEFFYAGFEPDTLSGHTGRGSYAGDYYLNFSIPNGRNYIYSYWYKQSGNWVFSGELAYTGAVTLSAGDAIDDVRVYPADAQMSTFTYDELVGKTSETDAKNMTTYYEYDNFQRLVNVKDQNGDIVKNYQYNYKVFGNAELSQVFTRNNCSSGDIPGQVTYTIPAGTYTSAVGQAEADALASAAIASLGQAYANSNGTCTTCSGADKKIINGVCETGVKVYTSSIPKPGGVYQCRFYYQWSDSSTSTEYIENNMPAPCIEE